MNIVFEKDRKRIIAYDGSTEAGKLEFRIQNDGRTDYWLLDHTYVNPDYRGQQIAQKMMEKLMEHVEAEDVKIVPICSFTQKECERHGKYMDRVYNK